MRIDLTSADFRILYTDATRNRAISQRMVGAEQSEIRRRLNTRPAQPGNNRDAVRETVRLLDAGVLKLTNDLVI